MSELTPREQRAVGELQALAKRWPRTLKLFSNSGTLLVIHSDDEPPYLELAHIDGIPNDGGDSDWREEGRDG